MIRYEIKKYTPSEYGVLKDKKFVKKSNLKEYLNNDWILIRKKYFIITHFLDWWRSLNTDQKISIIGITIGSIITIVLSIIGWVYFIN